FFAFPCPCACPCACPKTRPIQIIVKTGHAHGHGEREGLHLITFFTSHNPESTNRLCQSDPLSAHCRSATLCHSSLEQDKGIPIYKAFPDYWDRFAPSLHTRQSLLMAA